MIRKAIFMEGYCTLLLVRRFRLGYDVVRFAKVVVQIKRLPSLSRSFSAGINTLVMFRSVDGCSFT